MGAAHKRRLPGAWAGMGATAGCRDTYCPVVVGPRVRGWLLSQAQGRLDTPQVVNAQFERGVLRVPLRKQSLQPRDLHFVCCGPPQGVKSTLKVFRAGRRAGRKQ